MKKILSQKSIALALISIAFVATFYFYQQGKISFTSTKKVAQEKEEKIVEMAFADKEYRLSYQDKTDELSFTVADFENDENWDGHGEIDYTTFFEGDSSLFLSSADHQRASASLKMQFNIDDFSHFRFLIHLETDPDDLEEFNLIFADQSLSNQYKYIIRELESGWNFLSLSRERFSHSISGDFSDEEREAFLSTEIERVVIELVSRPKTRSIVNLDSLWAERNQDYLEDWNINSAELLSMKRSGETDSLLMLSLAPSQQAVFKRIGSAKDYVFQAKFTPLKTGSFGFFLRGNYKTGDGYYLLVDGAGSDAWRISKRGIFNDDEGRQEIILEKGGIANFQLEKNKTYWLKAEMGGSRIIFYLSVDGKSYTKLTEVRDGAFSGGGVGIAVSGTNMFFVDDLQFFQ